MKINLYKRFLFLSIFIYFLWKIYFLFFGQLELINDPLTNLLGNLSCIFLKEMNFDSSFHQLSVLDNANILRAHLKIADRIVVFIDNNCNGLDLHLLIFIFCISYGKGKISLLSSIFIFFIFWLIIFISNSIRISLLALLVYKGVPYFDLFHKYVFSSFVYILIFIMMLIWTRLVNNSYMEIRKID